jgi:hypothetical protein
MEEGKWGANAGTDMPMHLELSSHARSRVPMQDMDMPMHLEFLVACH